MSAGTPNFGTPNASGSASEVKPELTLEQITSFWVDANNALTHWKAVEMQLRLELVKKHSNPTSEKGTEYLSLPNDWRLKVVKSQNFKLDADKAQDALDHFTDDMANLLVRWDAQLSVSNYNQLSEADKAYFADALTVKPGAPQLELVPPKGGKK